MLCQTSIFTKTKVRIDWQFMLVVGIVLGAFISSATDKSFRLETCPAKMGEAILAHPSEKRAVGAFVGGVYRDGGALVLAGGCPSGHGLSGMMQLSPQFVCGVWPMFFGAGVWGCSYRLWTEDIMNTAQWAGSCPRVCCFGFLLQKGRVLRFDKQVGAMLLTDMTIFNFMLSAILVGNGRDPLALEHGKS